MSKIKKINLGGKDYDLHDATAQRKLNPTSGIILNNDTNEISSYSIHDSSEIVETSMTTGTAIPTDSLVEKVYFNTHLSIEEVVDICKNLTFISDPTKTTQNLISCCFTNTDFSYFIAVSKHEYSDGTTNYWIGYNDGTSYTDVFDSDEGWLVQEEFYLAPNMLNSLQSIANSLGYEPENSYLKTLIATEKFTQCYSGDSNKIYSEDTDIFYLANGKKQYLATKEDAISNLKAGTGISISEDGTISVSFETAEGNLF